ncbi:BufA1 family periplasmic bufferin-type metallophore [Acidithiobacillus sulfuriphilus]|uniref:BufA1 family periplasmic bufferin-type metallophore n=1 Tax=Acidithiobacillus sulfuriphilus TaxID=1867749 RepID=UPI003F61C910
MAGGLALAGLASYALDSTAQATTAAQAWHQGWVRCWGVNAAYKNDCLTSTASCISHDPNAHDPDAYVLMPAGVCNEIGGSAMPGLSAESSLQTVMQMAPGKRRKTRNDISIHNARLYYQSTAEYFSEAVNGLKNMLISR